MRTIDQIAKRVRVSGNAFFGVETYDYDTNIKGKKFSFSGSRELNTVLLNNKNAYDSKKIGEAINKDQFIDAVYNYLNNN